MEVGGVGEKRGKGREGKGREKGDGKGFVIAWIVEL